ncbi:hypothetical protein [Myroides odoratimimus]|uniref:hypothetical protein n=1 Tax=Myroides odoratimimus TaxID=76832 RepID=UPI00046A5376|nr:hypothetical protein [Myroides odoratimimus]
MNLEQLKEKAQTLIRESHLFVKAIPGDEQIAYVNEEESISFIIKYLNQWMALIEKDEIFSFEPIDIQSIDLKKYTALTTKTQQVYPNFEHLMHFGDVEVQQWVKDNDCNSDDLSDLQSIYNDDYIDLWMQSHPMYHNEGIYGYAGGWAMIWPEEDTPMQWDESLEFTYQIGLQYEPFIDIYFNKKQNKYICIERNT